MRPTTNTKTEKTIYSILHIVWRHHPKNSHLEAIIRSTFQEKLSLPSSSFVALISSGRSIISHRSCVYLERDRVTSPTPSQYLLLLNKTVNCLGNRDTQSHTHTHTQTPNTHNIGLAYAWRTRIHNCVYVSIGRGAQLCIRMECCVLYDRHSFIQDAVSWLATINYAFIRLSLSHR